MLRPIVIAATTTLCLAAMTQFSQAKITHASLVANLPGNNGNAVFGAHAPGRPDEMFVVDQRGIIQLLDLESGDFNASPFLDMRTLVDDNGSEQGLLGLAFDPNYATNGYFYVNYTHDPTPGQPGRDVTRIDRFEAPNPLTTSVATIGSRTQVLEFEQDFSNHNGGWIGFSPNDGYLYIATGDGGSGNDPNNRGQSLDTLLGKMLRIAPSTELQPTQGYTIPAENPFASDSDPTTRDEIWAYGLRNPWRASFDRQTGDLWIGDVGQGAREEINFQPGDSDGGENYGWRLREGDIATPGSVGGPEPPDHVGPAYDFPSNPNGAFNGDSVVGGYVYRGPDPEVDGTYIFGNTFPTRFWTFDPDDPDGTVADIRSTLTSQTYIGGPASFAEDAYGNLYILTLDGDVFRIETDALRNGDYNGDGLVNAADYQRWRADFGVSSGDSLADGNGDGLVNAADYTVWRNAVAEASSGDGAATVPEPGAALLALLFLCAAGSMGFVRRRFDSMAARQESGNI